MPALSQAAPLQRQPPRPYRGPLTQPALPELLDVRGLRAELRVSRAAALAIMRQLPEQTIPGLRKTYVRRRDVEKLLESHYTHKHLQ